MTRAEVQEAFGAAPDDGGPSDRMADEIVRLRQALREANRPPEDAEHHPTHLRDMTEMAIYAAVQIAQSDTSRCLSCGAWV